MSRRRVVWALAIPIAACAHGQTFRGLLDQGFRTLLDRNLITPQEQPNPTQPSGNPLPPVKRIGDLPQAGPMGPEGGEFHLIRSGKATLEYPLVHVTGGAEFTVRGYHVVADEVLGNRQTDTYTMSGHVQVVGADSSIYGDTVQVDFTNKTFVAENAESTLKPPLVKGRLKDNLYVKAHRSYGSESEIFGEGSRSTTCSYPSPHFEIVADKTDVRPGRRVIFRKVKIILLGHTILALPFLSVPLDERTYNNLPQTGHGQLEGYYIKNRFGVPLHGSDSFDTRFDYYTRLGTGLGGDYRYGNPRLNGILRLYTITGPHNEFDLSGQHKQNLGWGQLTLDGNYQRNNYLLASSGTVLNTRAQLLIPQGRSNSRLSFFRTNSDFAGSSTLQQTLTLDDNRFFGKDLKTALNLAYSRNESQFGVGQDVRRDQLNMSFRAMDDLQKADAKLEYIRSIPIGESANFFNLSDITPNLTIASDSKRLFGPKFDEKLPFTTQLSYGEFGVLSYGDSGAVTKGRVNRANFDFNFQSPRVKPGQWQINYQGAFSQSVYSDDTAQYVLREATQITYNFHNRSSFNIRYNYLRPYGFSPLQVDRRGKTNIVTSDLSYFPVRNLQIGAQTGYDFYAVKQGNPTAWQQVGLRMEYKLGRMFSARAISTYDTTRHAFGSTRLDVTWLPGSSYFSFGAKYDGIRHKWAAANLFLDGLQIGRLRASMLLNYNGYTKHFEAQHYSFIYDLHCAEAVLQILDNGGGFNSGRTVTFFIRLKALPFDTPFGVGAGGQPIGTGTGRD